MVLCTKDRENNYALNEIVRRHTMKKIQSFQVDHDKLLEGLYISRKDQIKDAVLTTYDIRMKIPNAGDYISPKSAHTLEHLLATFFRGNELLKDNVVYFGPMGCQTGMYLILGTLLTPRELSKHLIDAMEFVVKFDDELPGNKKIECGQYELHDLKQAKIDASAYLEILNNISDERMIYSYIGK